MLIPLAPILIPIIYGDQWFESIILVQILAIAGLSMSQGNPVGSLLLAKGYAKRGFYWNLFLVPIYLIGLTICAVFFGINGFALGKSIITTIMFGFGYIYLIKICIGNCFYELVRKFCGFLIFSLISALIIQFIEFNNEINQLLVQVIIGGIIYLIFVYIYDKKFIINFIQSFIIRKTHFIKKPY
jgi:O-antigen/teichoic acid export membrane protein